MTSLQKLRIHAILQRGLELEAEQIEKIVERYKKLIEQNKIQTNLPVIPIEPMKTIDFHVMYDKKGKLLENKKSKYHK